MSISSFFALALAFSAFNPLSGAGLKSFSEEEEMKNIPNSSLTLNLTPSPRRVSFSPAAGGAPSILAPSSASSTSSPRNRSRSCSSPSGRARSGSATPIDFRMAIAEGNMDVILSFGPVEPLSNRGKSPLAMLFEYENFDLAAQVMTHSFQTSEKVPVTEFIRLAMSSLNPKSIECLADVLKASGVDLKVAFSKAFPSTCVFWNALLQLDQNVAFPLINAVIERFEIELDQESRELLASKNFSLNFF